MKREKKKYWKNRCVSGCKKNASTGERRSTRVATKQRSEVREEIKSAARGEGKKATKCS